MEKIKKEKHKSILRNDKGEIKTWLIICIPVLIFLLFMIIIGLVIDEYTNVDVRGLLDEIIPYSD